MVSTMVGFDVQVVDGAGIPVPSIEVGARYRYPTAPRTWSAEMTDGDGCAFLRHGILLTTPEKMQYPNKSIKNGQ